MLYSQIFWLRCLILDCRYAAMPLAGYTFVDVKTFWCTVSIFAWKLNEKFCPVFSCLFFPLVSGLKCYTCISDKSFDECAKKVGNGTACPSCNDRCVKADVTGKRSGKEVRMYVKGVRYESRLRQGGRRLQKHCCGSFIDRCQVWRLLLRGKPVQWRQSTSGQFHGAVSMRSCCLHSLILMFLLTLENQNVSWYDTCM